MCERGPRVAETSGRGRSAWYDEPGTAFLSKETRQPAAIPTDAATIAAAEKALADHDYGKLIVEPDGPLYQLRGQRTPEGTDTQIAGRLWLDDAEWFAALPGTVRDLLGLVKRQHDLLGQAATMLQGQAVVRADLDVAEATVLRQRRLLDECERELHEVTEMYHGLHHVRTLRWEDCGVGSCPRIRGLLSEVRDAR